MKHILISKNKKNSYYYFVNDTFLTYYVYGIKVAKCESEIIYRMPLKKKVLTLQCLKKLITCSKNIICEAVLTCKN